LGWQVTATTLYCDVIGEWVTILVYKDGHCGCSHFVKFGPVNENVKGKVLECKGPDSCALCAAYRDDVFCRDAKADES
jgi:hypothetical protein